MYIKAKVTPGFGKEEFKKINDDTFEIKVKEPKQNNMANNRVLELVARHFTVPIGYVRILNGHHSPSKLISIRD